jgi:hypothetical protein
MNLFNLFRRKKTAPIVKKNNRRSVKLHLETLEALVS